MVEPSPLENPIPTGPTYDQVVVQRCASFAETLLADTPELLCMMVLPVWAEFPSSLAYSVAAGRHGAVRSPSEIQHLLSQLIAVTRHYVEKQAEALSEFERKAGQLQEAANARLALIREREAELARLDAAIAARGGPG